VISDHFPALLVVTPLILSFAVFAAGWFDRRRCFPLVVAALSACLAMALSLLCKVIIGGSALHYYLGGWSPPWGIEYVVDHLNGLMLVSIAVVALLVAIYSKTLAEKELPEGKLSQFYTLFLLQITGLLGITVTGDAFNLYVLVEIASFSAYAIIGMGEGGAPFAAFRYMIFGTIGACAYLLGIGYLYIITGSLNMADLRQLLPPLYHSKVLLTGFSFIMVGIAIKMALFPVHTWLPDAYTLAPSGVSALLAPLFTKVGAYVLIRVLFTMFDPAFSITLYPAAEVLGWIASVGVMFASIFALAQTDLKRMLCYLIVTEIGYIVIGVASANRFGLTGAIFHMVNDMFMMACLFAVAGTVFSHTGSRNINQLGGLHRTMPITVAVFVVGALSVIGVPPLCGFFSKWYLILGTIQAKQWVFLAVILVSTLLNAILFFRVIENVYFEPQKDQSNERRTSKTTWDPVAASELIPAVCFALFIIALGIFSGQIVKGIIEFAVPRVL
jgi:multicomponent Na+:H+ antiporter subunit D